MRGCTSLYSIKFSEKDPQGLLVAPPTFWGTISLLLENVGSDP